MKLKDFLAVVRKGKCVQLYVGNEPIDLYYYDDVVKDYENYEIKEITTTSKEWDDGDDICVILKGKLLTTKKYLHFVKFDINNNSFEITKKKEEGQVGVVRHLLDGDYWENAIKNGYAILSDNEILTKEQRKSLEENAVKHLKRKIENKKAELKKQLKQLGE